MEEVKICKVGIWGFGEAGQFFAEHLSQTFKEKIICYVGPESKQKYNVKAREIPISIIDLLEDLRCSSVILSVVTLGCALEVTKFVAPYIQPKSIFVDLNSTGPENKKRMAEVLKHYEVDYIDGTILGGGTTIDVDYLPIYLSGTRAKEFKDIFQQYGFNIIVIGDTIGTVAAFKLLRSLVVKGMEALLVEMLLATDHYRLGDDVLTAISKDIDRNSLYNFMNISIKTHVPILTEEMRKWFLWFLNLQGQRI